MFTSILVTAQDVRLIATSPGNTFRIGDWIDVRIEGQFNTPIDTIGPVVKDSIGPFEAVSFVRNGMEPLWVIRISTIDSGKVFLPPIEFQYRKQNDTAAYKAYTNSLLFTITGVAIDPKGEIKDIKPPLDAPWLFEDYIPYLIALIVLLLIGVGYYVYWKKKKLQRDLLADVKVIIPPHREALTALRILEEKKLWQQGLVKEYYSEVTEIIRRFFERRWEIIALELTTAEILVQMKHIPEALLVWKEMESFFLVADLVKFAKYQPTPEDHENEMRVAYEIVRAMVPKTPEVNEPQMEEATADAR
jgi:hypothetical protein